MSPKPLACVAAIEPYRGGDSVIPGIEHPIKLSSNENPLGASPHALEAYRSAATGLSRYPEGSSRRLRAAIAARYGLDEARILCSAGSDEAIQLMGRAYLAPGDEVIQSQYGFLMYRLMAQACGAIVRAAPDRDFTVDVDAMLALVGPRTKIVFLANPNNPTGTYIAAAALRRLHAGLPKDVLLVIDAAYAEYVARADYEDGTALAAEHDNVLMTRTFSKIHGLAALRLGWTYGAIELIEILHRVRGPFNVTGPAQAAGIAAIADVEFEERARAQNAQELERLTRGLCALGLDVLPSVANFALIGFGAHSAAAANRALRAQGLIVRDVSSYGLPNHLRISIGLPAENDAVLAALSAHMRAAA